MTGREISIRGQIGLSSKHLFLNALRTSRWADAASDVKRKIWNTEKCFMFWDIEKDEKLIFHCFGFHRCKMDLGFAQCWLEIHCALSGEGQLPESENTDSRDEEVQWLHTTRKGEFGFWLCALPTCLLPALVLTTYFSVERQIQGSGLLL